MALHSTTPALGIQNLRSVWDMNCVSNKLILKSVYSSGLCTVSTIPSPLPFPQLLLTLHPSLSVNALHKLMKWTRMVPLGSCLNTWSLVVKLLGKD